MFSEEGVTVHETPFSKDVVNAQALRVADSGKALSATGGEYFFCVTAVICWQGLRQQ
jgi:hypothetical protein